MSSLAATATTSTATSSSPPWRIRRPSPPLKLPNHPSFRVTCHGGCPLSPSSSSSSFRYRFPTDLKFVLHDALDGVGTDTSHARDARKGYAAQVEKLTDIERETSISINRRVDLAKTALCIAAEDDSIVSHSSVPLPVDAFVDRLDDLSMGYCTSYSSSFRASPESFLDSLDNYLYVKKGFRRSYARNQLEQQALYLHSVLTHRSGSSVMLSLVYSEILKMLRLWGLLDFDCEIFFPHDVHGLPRGYPKQKSKESDQPHIMTSQALLGEVLNNLKEAFWPFQHDSARSLFLTATHCIDRSTIAEESGFQLASAKAAQHRLDRGIWTSINFGDMRRAMSACERLILLETDPKELRDYSILLYHCGFYEQSLQYLKLYQEAKSFSLQEQLPNKLNDLEEIAVERLMVRLNLISMEIGWSKPSHVRNFLGNKSDPW